MKRWLLVVGAVVVVLGLITGGLWVVLPPDHRTTFLVDASESADFREVADAVGAAASTMPADDSLALRRFGGACDSPNTSELVSPGTGQAAEIGAAVRAITPSGKATLLNGILATIDDYARTYPFRGDKTNRVVVVARGAVDTCGKSADEMRTIIKDHTEKAGAKIDFRFVGHRLTSDQAMVLGDVAAASGAQKPRLTKTSDELVTTMKAVSTPANLAAEEVKAKPCDSATAETFAAVHLPEPNLVYADIKCTQDRYALGKLRSTQIESTEMPVLFEFKDNAWRFVAAQTDMACGSVPKDAWRQLNFNCIPEPVVCRDHPSRRVVDVSGWLGCQTALDIADRYTAALDSGQAQGQLQFWESGDWACSWPYEDGFSHAQVPLKCVRKSDNEVVQIGEYK